MKKKVMILIIVVLVGSYFLFSKSKDPFLERNGFNNLSQEKIVESLEDRTNKTEVEAGILGDRLEMSDSIGSYTMKLPKDKFYLSVAPYINQTHPCANHSLTGCQGELINEKVRVKIVDKNGKNMVNKEVVTYSNGFFGLWLPKNIEGTITVYYGEKSASTAITTFNNSETCLTTLKLQ